MPQVSVEKFLELDPCDRDSAVSILFLLVLLPAKADLVPKEGHGKGNFVNSSSSNSGKVVFILLTEVVVFYMGLFAIHIKETGFQGLISRLCRGDESFSLQNGLKNLLQVLFSIFGDRECSRKDNSNGKVCPWELGRLIKQLVSQLRRWKEIRRNNEKTFLMGMAATLDWDYLKADFF